MKWRGRIGMILLALLLAAGLIYGFMPRPVPVDVAAARTGTLAVTVEEEGKTRVMERYVISAPVAGYARRIDLKVGDAVRRGQVLAVLEPSRSDALDPRARAQAEARVSAAQAALAAAREDARAAAASAELADRELARSESLGRENFLSKSAVDLARTETRRAAAVRQAADAAANVARYELEAARAALAQSAALRDGGRADAVSVPSPVAGRVLRVTHESEGSVQAGQSLIEVGDPEGLEIEVEVLSTSAVKIAPGTPVRLDRWGGEQTLEAVVRVVEPTGFTKVSALGVEEQRVRVIADFTSPKEAWRRLGDGYRVEAAFVVWEGRDVLLAPTSALFRHKDGWALFVLADGHAQLRPVKVGQRNGLEAQVVEGLKAGEKIIAHPDDKIADGVRVKVRGE